MPLDLPKLNKPKFAVVEIFFFLQRNFMLPATKTPKEDFRYAFETGNPYQQHYSFSAENGLQIRRSYENYPYLDRDNKYTEWDVSVNGYHLVSFNRDRLNDYGDGDHNDALRWTDGKTTRKFTPFIIDAATELATLFIERKAAQLAAQIKEEEAARNKQDKLDEILVQLWKQKQST